MNLVLCRRREIDRPQEAIRYLEDMIEATKRRNLTRGPNFKLIHDPYVHSFRFSFDSSTDHVSGTIVRCGVALARAGSNDSKALEYLNLAFEYGDQVSSNDIGRLVETRVCLSRVLRRLQRIKEAEIQYVNRLKLDSNLYINSILHKFSEEWCTEWFKKNPHRLSNDILYLLLQPDILDPTPNSILASLGGLSWFKNRKATDKTEHRLVKACKVCRAVEPFVKLSLCSQCKYTYYWYVAPIGLACVVCLTLLVHGIVRRKTGRVTSKCITQVDTY